MKSLIRYCKMSVAQGDAPTTPDPTIQFNLKALHPFDAMKVVLEQVLFQRYLALVDPGENTEIFYQSVRDMMSYVPAYVPHDLVGTALGEYYMECHRLAHTTLDYHDRLGTLLPTPIDYNFVKAAFTQPDVGLYRDREYTSTITYDFLRIMLYTLANHVEVENGEVKPIFPGVLYTPEIKTVQHYHPDVASTKNKDTSMIYVLNPTISTASVNFDTRDASGLVGLYHFLAMYDYGDMSIEDMIGIISNFTTGTNQYYIDGAYSTPYLCLAIMTRSGDLSEAGTDTDFVASDVQNFIDLLKYLVVEKKRLRTLTDYPLFGMLLAAGNAGGTPVTSEAIEAYFIKDNPSDISANEAMSFRHSDLASFIEDRLMITTEAAGDESDPDDDEEDTTADEGQDEAADDMGDDDMGMDDEAGDASDALDTGDDEESEPENDKPQIDPSMMLMELANRYDTMSQYFFRKMVSLRFKAILDNPPPRVSSATLLMIRRWRSRWLYLVSIPCLRDFITRVGVRLSDTKY